MLFVQQMDDYSALAQRVAVTVGDVRGCLVLSRDGLVLGAYPEDESAIKPLWLKFATLGEPQKSFVEFGDQTWVYVHRGPYAAFVVAGTSVRPGILIDQMEQALLTAEEARTRREPLRVPDANAAPSGKPRTSLHPAAERSQPAEVVVAPADAGPPEEHRAWSRGSKGSAAEPAGSDDAGTESTAEPPVEAGTKATDGASNLKREPQKLVSSGGSEGEEDEGEIDRVLLAKEFSGLLQMEDDADEGSS
jgi:hypothetical protein